MLFDEMRSKGNVGKSHKSLFFTAVVSESYPIIVPTLTNPICLANQDNA